MAQITLNSNGVASSGALSLQSNGTTEAIGISTGQVATLAQNPVLTSGTANGVAYLNGSKVVTTGSALTFDGTNVGIGTSSPGYRLDASAGSSGSGVVNTFRLQNVGTTVGDGAKILFTAGASTDGAGIASTGVALNSADLRFYTGGNTERMRIDSSGNLLVGTTTTFATLTVNGNITPAAAPSTVWGIDFTPSTSAGSYVTIANNGTYDLASGSGFVFIYDEGASGIAQIACFYGTTAVIYQNATLYSTTSGTASKINVYYNSGTGKYRIQNTTGGSKNLWISTMRLRLNS